jgi:hypothetical protein
MFIVPSLGCYQRSSLQMEKTPYTVLLVLTVVSLALPSRVKPNRTLTLRILRGGRVIELTGKRPW